MNGSTNIGMDDHFEKGKGGTDGVRLQCQGGRGSEEAVHDIVGIRSKTDEKQKFRAFFDGADDTSNTCS